MRAPGPTLEDPEADVSHVGEVTSLAQSPDGKTVAVGYASGGCLEGFGVRLGGWGLLGGWVVSTRVSIYLESNVGVYIERESFMGSE